MKAASAPALTCPRHAANVLTMTDYPPAADHRHGNTTTYTYNDIGQLATLTAPGSKVWSYTYDTGNRLSRVDIPNGMHTEYTYDTSGRQDAILHKDGTTVVQGFEYTFEDGGNITRIDHEDGSYWEYDYDGRERLVEAVRGTTPRRRLKRPMNTPMTTATTC
jgi:YD repeat-containing protein